MPGYLKVISVILSLRKIGNKFPKTHRIARELEEPMLI